jgi:hypothetical protein
VNGGFLIDILHIYDIVFDKESTFTERKSGMNLTPGEGPLWRFLSSRPYILCRLIEWGETSSGVPRAIDGRCPICDVFPNWGKVEDQIPSWIVGYTTSWLRHFMRMDAGAWVMKCEHCHTKFCTHVHDTYHLEKFLETDPRWPKP